MGYSQNRYTRSKEAPQSTSKFMKVRSKRKTTREVYRGPAKDLPDGWIHQKRIRLAKTDLKGKLDPYWFSPQIGKRFGSKVQVDKFLACVKESHGCEEKALILWEQ